MKTYTVLRVASSVLLAAGLSAHAAVAPDAAWGDVTPTLSVREVGVAVGLCTVDYMEERYARWMEWLTNDFVAASAVLVTNAVDDMLAPRTLELRYGGDAPVTKVFYIARSSTSHVVFRDVGGTGFEGFAAVFPEGTYHNYTMLIDNLPEGMPWYVCDFSPLASAHQVYAQPQLQESEYNRLCTHAWDLTADDFPCIVSVREFPGGVVTVRREKLTDDKEPDPEEEPEESPEESPEEAPEEASEEEPEESPEEAPEEASEDSAEEPEEESVEEPEESLDDLFDTGD